LGVRDDSQVRWGGTFSRLPKRRVECQGIGSFPKGETFNMPTLVIDNVPVAIYERIQHLAKTQQRTPADTVIGTRSFDAWIQHCEREDKFWELGMIQRIVRNAESSRGADL
jgi:hypothetical protein